MNRRSFLGSLAAGAGASSAAANAKPNIVYILADDLGAGDLGCYNPASHIPTPHYDRFARQGIRFTDAHSPSSVCTPTRYGILTGRYCWRTRLTSGVLNGYSPNLIEPGRLTVASLLKQNGYHTGCVGKWHLGLGEGDPADFERPLRPCPNDFGFDTFFGIPASLDMPPYVFVENDRVVERATSAIETVNQPRGVFWRGGPIAPGFQMEDVLPALTRKAVDSIDDHARSGADKPLFLYLALTGPHTPWVPVAGFRGRSKAGDYGDFVAQVDDSVGQVLAALDRHRLASNSLVILTSDNGAHWTTDDIEHHAHRSNLEYRGMKADIWEAGHRIPFLARWPGRIPAGRTTGALASLTDLMATAAAVVGVSLPETAGEDSFNLLPALLGEKHARDAIVHHSSQGLFAIREGDWKLELGRGSGGFSEPRQYAPKPGEPAGELYNLRDDPFERNNLYDREPDRVRGLRQLLESYQRQGHSRPEAA